MPTVYYDAMSGLVPVKVIKRYKHPTLGLTYVDLRVTRSVRAYKAGEVLAEIPAHYAVVKVPSRSMFIHCRTATPDDCGGI